MVKERIMLIDIGNDICLKLKKNRAFLIILTFFWIYVIGILQVFSKDGSGFSKFISNSTSYLYSEALMEGDEISQTFICNEDGLNKIDLVFGTYARTNTDVLKVSLIDTTSKEQIFVQEINTSQLMDCYSYEISFDKVTDSKDHEYQLIIRSLAGTENNSVSVEMINDSSLNQYFRDGEKQSGVVFICLNYANNNRVWYFQILMYIIIILLSYIVCLNITAANEKTFLLIAIVFGAVLIFINPMFHAKDESTHYFRSFAISTGQFIDKINENGNIGAILPTDFLFNGQMSLKSIILHDNVFVSKYDDVKSFTINPYMSSVLPTDHVVAAIGIFVARIFRAPKFVVMWSARVADLSVYIAMCYLAIRNVKHYKNLFFVVSLLPMSLWLAGSCSQDPIINAAAILFVSICFKYRFDDYPKVLKRDMLIILVCVLLIASVKYLVYSPLLLLFFIIPRKKFNKNSYVGMIIIAISIVSICLLGQLILLKKFPFKEDRNGDVDTMRQLSYIFHHMGTTFRNFMEYAINHFLEHLKGFKYESATNLFAELACVFGLLVAPIVCKDKYDQSKISKKSEVVFVVLDIVLIFMIVGLCIISLYLGFTPVGKFSVEGLQTRYFIPILVPIMYLLTKINIKNHSERYEVLLGNIMFLGILDTVIGIMMEVF